MEKSVFPDFDAFHCQLHPKNRLSHLCCAPSCLSPLCIKCIKEHINTHKAWQTFPEIDLLDELRESCLLKVDDAISNFSSNYTNLEYFLQNPVSEDEEGLIKIRNAKEAIMTTIDNFFRELEERYTSLTSEGIQSQSPIIAERLKSNAKILQRLDKLHQDLQDKESYMEAIKLVLKHNFDREYEDFQNAIANDLTSEKTNAYSVRFNISEVDNLRRELCRIISIHQLSFQNRQNLVSQILAKINSRWNTQNEIPYQRSTHQSMQLLTDTQPLVRDEIFQNVKKADQIGPAQDKLVDIIPKESLVTEKDYFFQGLANKYLHFFQQKSHYLHLIDLESARLTGRYAFERVELKINFRIPRWHRSLITPFGEIYLTGGVDVEDGEKKLNESYVYDFNNQTLIPIDPMVMRRSGHAIIYLNGYIYAIGGYSDGTEFTNKCERYDIRQNSWGEIASLNLKANNPGCCTYNNQFIYKFGGKISDIDLNNNIEKYDTLLDRWTIIDFEPPSQFLDKIKPFNILSSLACIQVNATQIMFFGGTHTDYSIKSNECWVLCIENTQLENGNRGDRQESTKHKILQLKGSNLPTAEGFWNTQVIIDNKSLFCLQNIPNEKNDSIVYLDRRRVLELDFKGRWKILA